MGLFGSEWFKNNMVIQLIYLTICISVGNNIAEFIIRGFILIIGIDILAYTACAATNLYSV